MHDYSQAIREQVWVRTTVDSDADGRPDRVTVRIIRPRATGAELAGDELDADPNRLA